MKTFDVQAIEFCAPYDRSFAFIAEPKNLLAWASAFQSVSNGTAVLSTPAGTAEIGLEVRASHERGTIDWIMRFPEGVQESAYSLLAKVGDERCIFSFLLMAPALPLEKIEGALEQQSATLHRELEKLREVLSK
jgi:hypothetical protein